ncbi:ubiquinol-cytochrome c reductase iron-sulfur subunit [Isosphaeraceae bacterium EP7]
MAQRPSVKEILELARRGGAATPEGAAPAPAPTPEAEPELEAAPPPAAAEPAPTAASLGRPLTLKEKLAAARAGGAPGATPAPAASAPKPAAAAPVASGEKTVPAPAESLGRPLTLKEKLAAARSGGTAPAPAAGASASSAKPAAAKAAPVAKVARELPPLDEITDPKDLAEALRRAGAKKDQEVVSEAAVAKAAAAGATPGAAAAAGRAAATKAAPKVMPVPPRPSRLASLVERVTPRRDFNTYTVPWLAIGWISFSAGMGALSLMLGRFMFPNVLAEPPSTIKVGVPTQFEPSEVNERWKAEWGFWIVRSSYEGQDQIYALQSICTHLGCPPNWLASEQKFKCPCHGSGFYISGVNFEGPAPRPLERFKLSLADDGQLVVDKSQRFQQELGQWADPDSFIAV